MSWKSIVITGLLCVVASPVLAVPSLSITNTGLDGSGNWTWNVIITPTGGSSLAAELGLRETTTGSQLVSALIGTPAVWDTANPGTQIFNWETAVAGKYNGLQTNPATDEIFAAMGSAIQPAATGQQFLTIKTAGPTNTNLTTSLQLLGKYGTGGTNGRIAEGLGAPAGTNYSNFSGTATRTVLQGDVNLSGGVSIADLNLLATNFGKAGVFTWSQGDLNGSTGGTGEVSIADLNLLASKFGQNGGTNTPLNVVGVAGGAGSVSGGSVPEPASAMLVILGLVGMTGLLRRRN